MEDISYLHCFDIKGEHFEIWITRKKGFWETKVLKGESGVGNMCGGIYSSLTEYIENVEREHRYAYDFFGYPKNKI